MTVQPHQIDQARTVMRGHARDLLHNRRVDDHALAEANRVVLERRQRIPLAWRLRGALRDWWAGRANR